MTVVRRAHLYTGLMLVPWVMLYGVTAFLFNHPTVGTDRERRLLDPSELASTPFGREVDADALARLVADALAESLPDVAPLPAVGPNAHAAEIHFDPSDARFSGPARLEVRGGGRRRSFSYDVERGAVLYSSRPFSPSERHPLSRSKFRPEGVDEFVPVETWKDGARAIAAEIDSADLGDAEVFLRSGPVVSFGVEYEGVGHEVRYDVGRGTLSAERADEPASMRWRSFLLRLHLAHTYPASPGLRTLWAILVDAMALSMVAWAVSGLLMWWQIKRTRGIGAWMVALSVCGATVIGAGMYGLFVS